MKREPPSGGIIFREQNNVKFLFAAFATDCKIKFKYVTITKLIPKYVQING